jgi:hypothetical protein
MKKPLSGTVSVAVLVVACLVIGVLFWRMMTPQRVILEKGAKIPPPVDHRLGAQAAPTDPRLIPPDYRTGVPGR